MQHQNGLLLIADRGYFHSNRMNVASKVADRFSQCGRWFLFCLALIAGWALPSPMLAAPASPLSTLSEQELAWLEEHPVVRIGMDPHWEPFSSRDANGQLFGHDVDLLRAIEAQLPIKFEFISGRNWEEVYAKGIRKEIDVMASTSKTPQRAGYFNFTEAYFESPVVIVSRKEGSFHGTGMKSLADKKLALPKNHVITQEVQREHPELNIQVVDSMHEALRMVANNEADATMTSLPNATRTIASQGLTNLKIAGMTPMSFALRMAVRQDWPELVSILNKATQAIPMHQRQRILDRWINVDYEQLIVWERARLYFYLIVLLVFAVVGVLLIWNFTLRKSFERQRMISLELARTRDELTRLTEEQRHMLGIIAHDLKNPLTAMTLSADLLRMPSYQKPEAIHRISEDVGHMVSRMHHLVEQVLEFQQLNEGRRVLRMESLDVRKPLQDSLRLVQPSAELKGITVVSHLPNKPVISRIEHLAFSQIVENLVSNAVKFTPPGGRVEVELRATEDFALLEVRDNGPGIPKEEHGELFKRFVRLSNQPTGGESSTGLGLAIVHELTMQLGGRIRCESEVGIGSRFIVEIPLEKTPENIQVVDASPACA